VSARPPEPPDAPAETRNSSGFRQEDQGGEGNQAHRERDRLIAALARQHCVVATWQLTPLGFNNDDVHYRATVGRLHRHYRGVYSVGHHKLTREGRWMAAVPAFGPDAVVSHWTAAALWGFATSSWRAHVTTPTPRRGRRDIVAHVGPLHPEDVTRQNGIPVTSVARTILDIAPLVDRARLTRIIENAIRLEVFDLRALERAIARTPRRAGVPKLRAVLADYRHTPNLRSNYERIFRDLVVNAGLPEPQFNVLVEDFLVDAYWPQWRLIVEIDSIAYHMTPRAFERDRMRDAILQKAGYRVLRITEKRLKTDPQALIADIIALARIAA
jgi:very-short-patch-repair endonuclease